MAIQVRYQRMTLSTGLQLTGAVAKKNIRFINTGIIKDTYFGNEKWLFEAKKGRVEKRK